jgi:hypothetical protein
MALVQTLKANNVCLKADDALVGGRVKGREKALRQHIFLLLLPPDYFSFYFQKNKFSFWLKRHHNFFGKLSIENI